MIVMLIKPLPPEGNNNFNRKHSVGTVFKVHKTPNKDYPWKLANAWGKAQDYPIYPEERYCFKVIEP